MPNREKEKESKEMLRNTVRGVVGQVLTAAAMWLADRIVDRLFGSETATSA